MANNKKELMYLEPTLTGDSVDTLKSAFGLTWTLTEQDGNISLSSPSLSNNPLLGENKNDLISDLKSYRTNTLAAINKKSMVPNKQYVLRLIGNGEKINNDNEWLSFLIGGEYYNKSYDGIYTDSTFSDHLYQETLPYTLLEVKQSGREDQAVSDIIQITCKYNEYFKLYQSYIPNITNDRLLPNFYFLNLYIQTLQATKDSVITDIKDLITFSDAVQFSSLENLRNYLDKDYVVNSLDDQTSENINQKFKNLIFDDDFFKENFKDINQNIDLFPFYNTITFPTEESSDFIDYIVSNDYDRKFLKLLKETFTNQISELTPINTSFTINTKLIDNSNNSIDVNSTINRRTIDFVDFAAYSLNNYIDKNNDFCFVGFENNKRSIMGDKQGFHRYQNTVSSLGIFNSLLSKLNKQEAAGAYAYPYNTEPKYNEVIAYRVEKISGPPTGDSSTQNVTQNFWFLNSEDLQDFVFHDTQVKYDSDYTYNVYKYAIVLGLQYRASALAVTRTIADLEVGDPWRSNKWCLEFFDPLTGESTPQLAPDDEVLENELATEAQLISEKKYLADFKINYAPSVKIIEVPLASKTFRILDNPTNMMMVKPFYLLDDSQTIGFNLSYFPLEMKPFPTAINDIEETYKANYLKAYDLLNTDNVLKESISQPRTINVYRIDRKPTSIKDFDNNLVKSINMKIQNSDFSFRDTTYHTKVKTNQKYYFLFRFINELGSPCYNSSILEAQLVDDGGYKYGLFNAFCEEELKEKPFSNPSISFKKLINLVPNIKNVLLDDSKVDYSNDAVDEMGNILYGNVDDSVWDKTFKIRLTSKKTGKKIDINVTYKLRS